MGFVATAFSNLKPEIKRYFPGTAGRIKAGNEKEVEFKKRKIVKNQPRNQENQPKMEPNTMLAHSEFGGAKNR